MKTLPKDFNPALFDEIPSGPYDRLFEGKDDELEQMGREAIQASLTERLGKPVIPVSVLQTRFGLKKLGYSIEDIQNNKILVR